MHTAFDCSPLLHGYREKPESILVHGAKLFIGSSTGTLSVFRIDQTQRQQRTSTDDNASLLSSSASPTKPSASAFYARSHSSIQPLNVSDPIQVSKTFSRRSIDQLGVIKETNTLVSLSDGHVSLHDISTLGPQTQLPQTRGALTFSIDTSIQKQISNKAQDYGPGPLGSLRGSRFAPGGAGAGQAYRPGATFGAGSTAGGSAPRTRSGLPDSPSKGWQSASLRGMDAIIKHKEEEKRRAMEGARFGGGGVEGQEGVMTLVTVLTVGLRRKVIFFRWVDGEFWDTREVPLSHTPRSLAFPTPTKLFMGYNATEYGILSIPLASESTVAFTHPSTQLGTNGARRDVHVQPPTNSTSGALVDSTATTPDSWSVVDFDIPGTSDAGNQSGNGAQGTAAAGFGAAFGGLGGYIGMTGKGKPTVLQVDGGEVLVASDNAGIFLGADGKPTRRDGIEWPSIPDEIAYAKPYVFAILPAGSVPTLKQSQASNANNQVLQIRSASTLVASQTLCFPPLEVGAKASQAATSPPTVRLLTTSAASKPPIYIAVTPTDRRLQEKDGTTIWRLDMQAWGRQIDELVEKGEFQEALGLLDSVDEVILEDKVERRALVQGLYAVSLFSDGKYDEAIEAFTELDMNPAKVLALYPRNVAGDLSREREDWMPIFGGKRQAEETETASLSSSPTPQPMARTRFGSLLAGRRPQSVLGEAMLASLPGTGTSPSKMQKSRSSLGVEDNSDAASVRSVRSNKDPRQKASPQDDSYRKSLDALGRFLADRRRIFKPILENLPQLASKDHMTMSQIKRDSDWLLSLPNKPLGSLEKDELMAVAQTVDTALFKTFLETKPALVGPLCRVENWCEVEQVEELLKERKKFSELIALYGGKEMHVKALELLKQFSEDEDDEEEKVGPTIRYLQNLGHEFIGVILETSHWVLQRNPKLGMEIFTADTGKVSSLPRYRIVADLESFDKDLCAQYLEHIITTLGEGDPELHDKLALLYLRKNDMDKLLIFLRTSQQYRAEQLLGRLPEASDRSMYEARALLLGRMGQHEGALGIYVRKLQDPLRAEQYCASITDDAVFLTLLKIYLKEERKLEPALELIQRHATRINLKSALEMLPPLVPLQTLENFIRLNLREQTRRQHEAKVVKQVRLMRQILVDETLCRLQSRRVKVGETRTCPRCHKRLGNSVVAVQPVSGAVMHYFCMINQK